MARIARGRQFAPTQEQQQSPTSDVCKEDVVYEEQEPPNLTQEDFEQVHYINGIKQVDGPRRA